jgi:RIO-like serine/threonine protein kinase
MIIKEFQGFSGNQIYLIKGQTAPFVRKIGSAVSIGRNVERLLALSDEFPVPEILAYTDTQIDMEYIHGLDIKTYLTHYSCDHLINFITDVLERLSHNAVNKDYTDVYQRKLASMRFESDLPFGPQQLLDRLPKILPSSNYHGDFTLENIIYSQDQGFYLIDCVTIEYNSYVFDIAKMRQDLDCGWFTRNDSVMLDVKTHQIQQQLLNRWPLADNDYILILMLLRVYQYTRPHTAERDLLIRGINRLWK